MSAGGAWVDHGGDCDDHNASRTVACGSCAQVDFLVVMDTSPSMIAEQAALASQLGPVVRALQTGDIDGDGVPEADPIADLHVGVVTPDLGTGPYPVASCTERGEDGILRDHSGVMDCAGLSIDPRYLAFTPDTDEPTAFADDWSCLVRAGVGGCGFEQPLDASLQALTPAGSPLRFFDAALGQADGPNLGFLRPDSLLVVLVVTDEDDCSAEDRALFELSGDVYPGPLGLRCSDHPEALHPITRYVSGLLALRDADQIIFAVVAGLPLGLVPDPRTTPDYAAILAAPQMQEVPDATGTSLIPSCSRRLLQAYPPRRLLQVAQGLEERGATTTLSSICQADGYTRVAGAILEAAVRDSAERCGPGAPMATRP